MPLPCHALLMMLQTLLSLGLAPDCKRELLQRSWDDHAPGRASAGLVTGRRARTAPCHLSVPAITVATVIKRREEARYTQACLHASNASHAHAASVFATC